MQPFIDPSLFDAMTVVELGKFIPEGGFTEIERQLKIRGISLTRAYIGQIMGGKELQNSREETLWRIEQIRLEAVKLAKKYYEEIICGLQKIQEEKINAIKEYVKSGSGLNWAELASKLTLKE